MIERVRRGSWVDAARRWWALRAMTLVRLICVGVLIAAVFLMMDRYSPNLRELVDHYFDYGIITLMGAAIAVLLIDTLNEQRIKWDRKQTIIQQMGSTVPGMALEAVRLATLAGWLEDGSLRAAGLLYANLQGARLGKANLQGAELTAANLQGAWLMGANLQKAWLAGANMHGAVLMGINLQGASLTGANLEGAMLIEANLIGADLRKAKLAGAELTRAKFDGSTRLPDDTKWKKGADMARFTNPKHPEFWSPPEDEA